MKQDLFDYYQKDSQQILDPIAQTNSLNYRYEMPDVTLNHIYAVSQTSKNNLVWDEERKRIIYTSQSIIIIEDLNKTQKLISEGNDTIFGLEISLNKKFLLAFTKEGHIDGTPMIYIWELSTLKKRA